MSTYPADLADFLKDHPELRTEVYGEPSRPRLSTKAASAFVGIASSTLCKLEHAGAIKYVADQGANGAIGPHPIWTFHLPGLRALRDQRAQDAGDGTYHADDGERVCLKKAASISRVPYRTVLKELRRSLKGRAEDLRCERTEQTSKAIAASVFCTEVSVRRIRPAFGGKPELTILLMDAKRLGVDVKALLARKVLKGFAFFDALAGDLGVTKEDSGLIELRQCLQCWREHRRLTPIATIRAQSGTVKPRTGKGEALDVERLLLRWAWPVKEAKRLWEQECTADVGAAMFKRLLADGPRKAAAVKEEMRNAGIVGIRLDKARKQARVSCRLEHGAGSPWVYELARGKPARSLVDLLQALLASGPVPVDVGETKVKEWGYPLHGGESKAAKRKLGIRSVPSDPQSKFAPWYWCRPGQTPPVHSRADLIKSGHDRGARLARAIMSNGPVASKKGAEALEKLGLAREAIAQARSDAKIKVAKLGRGGWCWYLEQRPSSEADLVEPAEVVLDPGDIPVNGRTAWTDCPQSSAAAVAAGKPSGGTTEAPPAIAEAGPTASAAKLITIAKAFEMTGINKGTISRAVASGAISSNGKRGRACRLDLTSFGEWQLARTDKPEPAENETTVRRKVKKHTPK